MLARLYATNFNHEDAIDAAVEALEDLDMDNKDKIEMYKIKGISNQRLGNKSAAISDYSKMIDIDPTNQFAWYLRGGMKYKIGDMDGALEDATEAVELDPTNEDARKLFDAVKRKQKDS